MKRLVSFSLIIALFLLATACDAPSPPDELSNLESIEPSYPAAIAFGDVDAVRAVRKTNQVSDAFNGAINQFAFQTAVPILQNSLGNAIYSPLSLYFALSLAGSGAQGTTQREILKLLDMSDPAGLLEQNGKLYRLLYTNNEINQLKVANSLWLDEEYQGEPVQFKSQYTKNAVDYFYASLFKVDFAQESTGRAIAQWISKNTDNTLQPEFRPDSEQIMSIINTIYYRDEWSNRFDVEKTRHDTFFLADGQNVTCDFMNKIDSSSEFSRGAGFTRASLQLKSQGSMIFILPDENVQLSELISSPAKLREAFEGGHAKHGKVTWQIPKFTDDSKLDLKKTLQNLGIKAAFTGEADFSGITDHQAFISSIIQNAHLAIDEKGVVASAFTKIDYYGAMAPEAEAAMILNRPFLYGIYSSSGHLLFIGICGNPA